MDCEKFEPLLLDELYGELDEVTSAAVKRHVSGCARCASILTGMKSTRRLAVLPTLDLPEGLEDRILASVKEAQKVVPIQSRASRALSWAGNWAMRPQTAMAAVFLLMIGTSAFVIRSRHSSEHTAAVSITEQGVPAGQVAQDDDHESLDSKAAAAAHGANQPVPTTAPPVAVAPGGPVASAGAALAFGNDPSSAGTLDGITAGKGRVGGNAKEDNSGLLGSAFVSGDDKNKDSKEESEGARTEAEKKRAPAKRAASSPPSDIANAAAPAGAPMAAAADRDYAPRGQSVAPPPATKALEQQQQQDGFSAGMAAYRSRNFPEATRQFDSAARTGDQNAALWAAKSVKDGNGGCSAALPRFDAVAQRAGGSGSWVGSEAQLEAARCQIATGQLDAARDKLSKLTSVPSHAAPAQQALNELNQVASKREAERAKSSAGAGGGGVARPAAPAPVRAPARPAATAAKPAADDANKASGF
jgi:hypothetical protein